MGHYFKELILLLQGPFRWLQRLMIYSSMERASLLNSQQMIPILAIFKTKPTITCFDSKVLRHKPFLE